MLNHDLPDAVQTHTVQQPLQTRQGDGAVLSIPVGEVSEVSDRSALGTTGLFVFVFRN